MLNCAKHPIATVVAHQVAIVTLIAPGIATLLIFWLNYMVVPMVDRAERGQKWGTWEDLDDKRWIVLIEKEGGKEGEMEEWDLVEEFFNRIRKQDEE